MPCYEKSKLHQMTRKWSWTFKVKGTPYIYFYTSVLPYIFQKIEVFSFSIGYNCEFEIFETKIVKTNRKLKFSKT